MQTTLPALLHGRAPRVLANGATKNLNKKGKMKNENLAYSLQAISTRVLPATNTKGTRIRATHPGKAESIVTDAYSDTSVEAHAHAARLLIKKLGWEGEMVGGSTANGMAWVFTSSGRGYPTSPRIRWSVAEELYEIDRDMTGQDSCDGSTPAADTPTHEY